MDKQELSDFLEEKDLSEQTPKEEQDKIFKEALAKIDDSYEKYSKQTITASIVIIVIIIALLVATIITDKIIYVCISEVVALSLFEQGSALIIRSRHLSNSARYTIIGIIIGIFPIVYFFLTNLVYHFINWPF